MSAYPLLHNKPLEAQKIKMAMALKGKNNHYHWHAAQRRHFIETAKFADYSVNRAEKILDEMLNQVDSVISIISKKLPSSFPQKIAEPILEGMYLKKNKLIHV